MVGTSLTNPHGADFPSAWPKVLAAFSGTDVSWQGETEMVMARQVSLALKRPKYLWHHSYSRKIPVNPVNPMSPTSQSYYTYLYLVGGWTLPLGKIWISQLGWIDDPKMPKIRKNNQIFLTTNIQQPNTNDYVLRIVLESQVQYWDHRWHRFCHHSERGKDMKGPAKKLPSSSSCRNLSASLVAWLLGDRSSQWDGKCAISGHIT